MINEKAIINDPITPEQFKNALTKLGVKSGQIIEVHSKLSSFHYLVGGARTVVDTLLDLEKNGGTIVMPLQVSDNTEPSEWNYPGVTPDKYRKIRESIPSFDPKNSDISSYMGSVVENFRHRDGVVVSNHPNCAYSAWGRYARLLCNSQSMNFPLAEESPTARIYELKGYVLLIGCDFTSATCLHLAEYRSEARPIKIHGGSVNDEGSTKWKKYLDLDINSDVFKKVETIMKRKNMIREIMLGGCKIQFFSASQAIDELCQYFEQTNIYELYR